MSAAVKMNAASWGNPIRLPEIPCVLLVSVFVAWEWQATPRGFRVR
jgi:hypothetical protein